MRKFAVALVVAVVLIGAAIARANNGLQIPPGNGLSPEERLGVQGQHYRLARDLGRNAGRDLVIDDVVVGTDRIAVRYHATGIQPVGFENIKDNPIFAAEGPTLITAMADGKLLIRVDSSTSGEQGSSSVRGEIVFRWQGGPVHHLGITFSRIMGDELAAWTTTVDF